MKLCLWPYLVLTAILTLTKPENRGKKKPAEEQFHVLPHYVIDETDEEGKREGQEEKFREGHLEVLGR